VDIAEWPVAVPQRIACRFGGHAIHDRNVGSPGQLPQKALVQGIRLGRTSTSPWSLTMPS
jgi:hypothetical protein